MKKALIAGAASAVLAAMPVVGVFADTVTSGAGSFTDVFTMTIPTSCTFERASTAHPDAGLNGETTVNWTTGTDPTANQDFVAGSAGREDTMALGNVVAGRSYYMGSSQFKVTCNVSGGYDVTLTAGSLSNGNAKDNIALASTAVAQNASGWTITDAATDPTAYYENEGIVKSNTQENTPNGETFTVHYNVTLKDSQAAGTYSGSATYTLTQPHANN